jgi:hypothetical protein
MPSLFPKSNRPGLPQTTRSSIYYEIESLTPSERWAPGANLTTMNCRVDADDAYRFIEDMVGSVYVNSFGVLRRYLPEKYPYANQWCTRVEQIDQGGDPNDVNANNPSGGPGADPANGWPVPQWIRYRCTFEGMPFDLLTDDEVDEATGAYRSAGGLSLSSFLTGASTAELYRYVERKVKSSIKEQQVPGGAWYIVDPTAPPGTQPAKLQGQSLFKRVGMADVQYVWNRVPVVNLPLGNINACLGCVNNAIWDTIADTGSKMAAGGYCWYPGTLLFTGWDDSRRYFDADGTWVVDIVYFFEYKSLPPPPGLTGTDSPGWNWFLNAVGVPVTVTSDGQPYNGKNQIPYYSADFNQLFSV